MKYKLVPILITLSLLIVFTTGSVYSQNVDKLKYPKLNKLEVPNVEKITLDNGIRLYLLQDNSLPIFHGSIRINCGGYLDPDDKIGLASICGTVLRTGGTSKWTGDEIDEKLEAIGGSVETSIGALSGSARVNILSDYTDLGLEVLAEILRNPVFDKDKIDLAKVQARSEISRRNDDPFQIALREYRKIIYGTNSPYARHPEYATINAIERTDLVDYHRKYFKPQNIQMAFWGDFNRDDLLKKIKTYFGDWKKDATTVPPLPQVDYKFEQAVYYINKPDVNQTNILMGHIGGLTTDDDYPARIVMNNILGGGFGSRMFNTVRSKEGLAYSTFASYTANIKYPGVFYAFASTKSETTGKCIKEVIKVVKDMQKNPPTEDEMRMGKDGYLNSFVFNFDSKGEVVNRLMRYDFYGLPDDYLFQEKEKVEKVTADDVITAAKKNLHPDAMRILIVGKSDDFDTPVDKLGLGAVDTIDITIPSGEKPKEVSVSNETVSKGVQILKQAIDAHGGLDAFKKVKSVNIKSTLTIKGPGGNEMSLQQEYLRVYPDKSRAVTKFMGMNFVEITDGTTGWKTDRATMKVVPMTEDDLKKKKVEGQRNYIQIFGAFDDPYYKAVYDGSGTIGDTPVDYVAIVDKDGNNICRLGIDQKTHLLKVRSFMGEGPMGPGTIEERLSNFTDVQNLKVPMTSEMYMNGQKQMTSNITSFIINGDIPANSFAKPE